MHWRSGRGRLGFVVIVMLLGTLVPPAAVIAEPGPENTNSKAEAKLASPAWGWGDNTHSELGDGVICPPAAFGQQSACQILTPEATDVHSVVGISLGVNHSLGLNL